MRKDKRRSSTFRKEYRSLRILRSALDWLVFFIEKKVSVEVWTWLVREQQRLGLIYLPTPVPMVLKVSGSGSHLRLSGVGLQIHVYSPIADPKERVRAGHVFIQLDGSFLSASPTGCDVVEQVRRAVEKLFYPHLGATARERRALLGGVTFPGRTDLAIDVMLPTDDTATWLDERVSFHGKSKRAQRYWVPAPGSDVSTLHAYEGTGITLRRSRWSLGIYDKRKQIEEKPYWNLYSTDVLEKVWRDAGWDGEQGVVRVELRVLREWLTGQTLNDTEGDAVTLDQWLCSTRSVVSKAFESLRHSNTPKEKGRSRKHNKRSPLWLVVEENLGRLPRTANRLAPVTTANLQTRQDQQQERSVRIFEKDLRQLRAHGGPGATPLSKKELQKQLNVLVTLIYTGDE